MKESHLADRVVPTIESYYFFSLIFLRVVESHVRARHIPATYLDMHGIFCFNLINMMGLYKLGTYLVQTNLSVQTVQTNCGGEVGGGICKSVITPAPNHTFAKSPSHLSPAVGLHEEVDLHLIRCLTS